MENIGNKTSVLTHQKVVKPNFASAVLRSLNVDQIPMNGRGVDFRGLGGAFAAAAWGEVDAAGDFFIEENVLHRLCDIRVDTDGKFADIAGAFVGIQYFVDSGRIVGGGFDDLSFLKLQAHIFIGIALVF